MLDIDATKENENPSTMASTSSTTDVRNSEVKSIQSSSSWWSYVGFRGSDAPSSTLQASKASETSTGPDVVMSTEGEQVPVPPRVSVSEDEMSVPQPSTQQHEGQPKAPETAAEAPSFAVHADGSSSVQPQLEGGAERAKSITSSQSNWLSPWGWYDWYAAAPASAPVSSGHGQDQDSARGIQNQDSNTPKTEAERIKEEALARPDPPSSLEHPEATNSVAPDGCKNTSDATIGNASSTANDSRETSASTSAPRTPSGEAPLTEKALASSLAVNTKGWVSFFSSSRSLSLATTRSVTEKGDNRDGDDGDGMEVMDIDEDTHAPSEGQIKSAPPSLPASRDPSSEYKPKSRSNSKPPSINITSNSPSKGDSNNRNAGNQQENETMKSPITTSAEPKRKASIISANASAPTKRDVSPTPSKKSAKSVPGNVTPKPKPPNLVLPTFDDTFKAPPRSTPPAAYKLGSAQAKAEGMSAKSRIRKTLGIVSNVLFAREDDPSASAASGSGLAAGMGAGLGRKDKEKESVRQCKGKEKEGLEVFGDELPRAWEVLDRNAETMIGEKCKRVVVIGVHGWFPGELLASVYSLLSRLISCAY